MNSVPGLTSLPALHARRSAQIIERATASVGPGLGKALLGLANDTPFWLRHHGLHITLLKLREIETDGNRSAAAKLMSEAAGLILAPVLQQLDPEHPLDLSPGSYGHADPGAQSIYITLSAVARERADAFAMAAKALLDKPRQAA